MAARMESDSAKAAYESEQAMVAIANARVATMQAFEAIQ